MMPIERRTIAISRSLKLFRQSPATRTSPKVGRKMPAIIDKARDLPEPVGPCRHTNSPRVTLKVMPGERRCPLISMPALMSSTRGMLTPPETMDAPLSR